MKNYKIITPDINKEIWYFVEGNDIKVGEIYSTMMAIFKYELNGKGLTIHMSMIQDPLYDPNGSEIDIDNIEGGSNHQGEDNSNDDEIGDGRFEPRF